MNEALSGASFVSDDDDPFEGLTPAEIEAMVAREAPAGDAFEGMSPEEINAYLQKERWEREHGALPPPPPPEEGEAAQQTGATQHARA